MAYTTKVVLIGKRVKIWVRGFDVVDVGDLDYGTAQRTMAGRAERVEAALTIDDDEVSSLDEILKHHERTKLDWVLTMTEIKHIFNPADPDLGSFAIEVPDDTGALVSLQGADALEDCLFGFSHAAVAIETPLRLLIFWGAIVGGTYTQDRNSGRDDLRLVPISLGVSDDGTQLPNPQILDAGSEFPW